MSKWILLCMILFREVSLKIKVNSLVMIVFSLPVKLFIEILAWPSFVSNNKESNICIFNINRGEFVWQNFSNWMQSWTNQWILSAGQNLFQRLLSTFYCWYGGGRHTNWTEWHQMNISWHCKNFRDLIQILFIYTN